jgi:hypothetical protein
MRNEEGNKTDDSLLIESLHQQLEKLYTAHKSTAESLATARQAFDQAGITKDFLKIKKVFCTLKKAMVWKECRDDWDHFCLKQKPGTFDDAYLKWLQEKPGTSSDMIFAYEDGIDSVSPPTAGHVISKEVRESKRVSLTQTRERLYLATSRRLNKIINNIFSFEERNEHRGK